MNFDDMTDNDLKNWLAQYSGRQAGFYPGLRKTRARCEREAARRSLGVRPEKEEGRVALLLRGWNIGGVTADAIRQKAA